jgi:lysophospholipase L1-like esterase
MGQSLSHLRPVAKQLTTWLGSFVAVALITLASLGLVLSLWPTDSATVAGVPLEVGARLDITTISGPAYLVSHGETRPIRAVLSHGPLRPLIITTATTDELITAAQMPNSSRQASQDLMSAYQQWLIKRSILILLVAGLLLACLIAFVDRWVPWRWRIRLALALALAIPVIWGGSVTAAAQNIQYLQHLDSLSDLFDYQKLRTAPAPTGEKRTGYDVVVLGDSRVSLLGGAPLAPATPDDQLCNRSRDSLAAQLTSLEQHRNLRTLNLACAGATVETGLMGPQTIGDRQVPPQIGLLKQVEKPKAIVIAIGPNDVSWGDFLAACYATDCNVTGLEPTLNTNLVRFQRGFLDVLDELSQLPGNPQVIVVGSYELFSRTQACPDTAVSPGQSINVEEIEFLRASSARFNRILEAGAATRHFSYIEPRLTPLCQTDLTGLGPDILGLDSPYRFHPTPLGQLKLAAQVAAELSIEQP